MRKICLCDGDHTGDKGPFWNLERETGKSNIFLVNGYHRAFTNRNLNCANLMIFKFALKSKEINCPNVPEKKSCDS